MALELGGKTLETDEEGYLLNLDDWTKEVADELAKAEKIDLLNSLSA